MCLGIRECPRPESGSWNRLENRGRGRGLPEEEKERSRDPRARGARENCINGWLENVTSAKWLRRLSYLLLGQVSLRGWVGEEKSWGTLVTSPPGAAQGESETPGCHLTIPLLVNRRGDATGSRGPASPSRAEVTCWERLLGPPAGLFSSVLRPGTPPSTFHPVALGPFFTLPLPSDFSLGPLGHSASFVAAQAISIFLLFSAIIFLRAFFATLKVFVFFFLRHSEQKYSSEKQ